MLAVTTSAGNQTPDKILNNALRILTLLGRDDIPVSAGAPKPLARELTIADNVHGESGLDAPKLPDSAFAPHGMTGIELMARCLLESPEPVTLVLPGTLTNITLLLAAHPELKGKIARIVLMGAATGAGNWTPAAEFNIYVDPEAGDMFFKSGIPITMCSLDVTHEAQVMDEDIERVRAITNPLARCVAGLLDFFMIYHRDPKWGFAGVPLHSPLPLSGCSIPPCSMAPGVPGRYRDPGRAYREDDGGGSRYGLTGKPANALLLGQLRKFVAGAGALADAGGAMVHDLVDVGDVAVDVGTNAGLLLGGGDHLGVGIVDLATRPRDTAQQILYLRGFSRISRVS